MTAALLPMAQLDALPGGPAAAPVQDDDLDTIAPLVGPSVASAAELFRRRHTGEERPLPLPWPGMAQKLGGGLWPGCHILTGTTAAGKTACAMQCALRAAQSGHPVLYIGLELDTAQIIARLASLLAGSGVDGTPRVHWSEIYLGKAAPSLYAPALAKLDALPIRVEEAPPGGWSAKAMRARVEALRVRHPGLTPLIVLDFLQLVGPTEIDNRREELRERIGRAAYEGREVARRCGAAVLMLSSISRAGATELSKLAEGGQLGIGDAADLVGLGKESGDIEFSADSVLCLAREPRPADAEGPAKVWVAVAKQRAGRPTWALLSFNGSWLDEVTGAEVDRHMGERRTAKEAVKEAREAQAQANAEAEILELLASGPQSTRGIRQAISGREAQTSAAITALARAGKIARTAPGVGGYSRWALAGGVAECGPGVAGPRVEGGVGGWCGPASIGPHHHHHHQATEEQSDSSERATPSPATPPTAPEAAGTAGPTGPKSANPATQASQATDPGEAA